MNAAEASTCVRETYSWFEINQDRARDIARIIGLVEEDVLAITALCGKVLEVAILTDTMLLAELLPELTSNYQLYQPTNLCVYSSYRASLTSSRFVARLKWNVLLLPHWPA